MRLTLPFFAILLSCMFFVVMCASTNREIRADDTIEGAVWQFEMSEKSRESNKLVGRFRLSNNVLYQKEKPRHPTFNKQVGKNFPKGKVTRFEVTEFRALPKGNDKIDFSKDAVVLLKGTGRMSLTKIGEWEGLFTDDSGINWNFKAVRIAE